MGVQEQEQLWGGETTKAVANFPVSGEPIPVPVVRWLGRIKGAAARVNAELGLLDQDSAERIAAAADRDRRRRVRRPVPDRRVPDRLGHLVEHERQRGDRERSPATASTPTTTSTWASPPTTCSRRRSTSPRSTRPTNDLLPALERARGGARARRRTSSTTSSSPGRTHLMDAVPVTLGQEFAGYAAQVRLGARRIRNALPQVAQIPLGGTATGTGLNTHTEFAARVRARLTEATGLEIRAARGPVRGAGQPRRARRALGRAQGASRCR